MFLSSVGAFFHFLLDHEISIVESWLHNNHWEIIIISKTLALFFLVKWFNIRLYQIKPMRELLKTFIKRPEQKAIVISFFVFLSYLTLGDFSLVRQNFGYWYNHLISFAGVSIFFGLEFFFMAFLNQIHSEKDSGISKLEKILFTLSFAVAYRLSIPDYYDLFIYSIFCYSILFFMTGLDFKNSSNVLVFIFIFISPMCAFWGLDPIWGEDFSIFRFQSKLKLPFLVVIWMICFTYYKYRELILSYARKFIR